MSDYFTRKIDGKPIRIWRKDCFITTMKHWQVLRGSNILNWRDGRFKSIYDENEVAVKRKDPWMKSVFRMEDFKNVRRVRKLAKL